MSVPICIFEDDNVERLNPFTFTRPVYDLRCGILTLREKIEREFPDRSVILFCRDYLAEVVREQNPKTAVNQVEADSCLFVNGRVVAEPDWTARLDMNKEKVYVQNGEVAAAYLSGKNLKTVIESKQIDADAFPEIPREDISAEWISYPWDLVNRNAEQIRRDFHRRGRGGNIAGEIHEQAVLLNRNEIHIGTGSQIKPGVVLDAESGPIYIGENVHIMPNAVIEGPAFVGDGSIIKIGAKIYEGTSIGAVCKVGGEVEESIIHSFSNKQHDGFLGHAYLGQWVNLGADTNNSDLKNNYGSVRMFVNGEWVDSGSQFVGLFMGDHSKTGINTMFNTGTIVGPMSNVFGSGFPPKFIPAFSWGGTEERSEHDFDKAIDTARRVMARRDVTMTSAYEKMMRYIFKQTRDDSTA